MTSTTGCFVRERTVGRALRAVEFGNELLATTVLCDKGADIYELVYRPQAIDVLWKPPWTPREPSRGLASAFQSTVAWLEAYPGGWQEIFPSGGGPCVYKGVELNFHGEASMIAWDYDVVEARPTAVELRFTTRLYRSPFRLERVMRVERARPVLLLMERIANEGGEPMDYMWGHHPAYGAPFLSAACCIDIGARTLRADDLYVGTANPLECNSSYQWPHVERLGQITDMAQAPGPKTPRDTLAYFEDFESGWYAITNTDLGFGVGLAWPKDVFPYAWFWQEMHASPGYPWYKGIYTMAIEPFTSIPGQGLVVAMEKTGTHCTLAPGQFVEAELSAVFYESKTGIRRLNPDGSVVLR